MNSSIHVTNNSGQAPGMKLLSNAINESQSQKPHYLSHNRRIPISRTPDRLFYNDYGLSKTPSIKGITDKPLPLPYHRYNLSIVRPAKNRPVEKNMISNKTSKKRLIDIPHSNIIRTEFSRHDQSFSHSHSKKPTDKTLSKVSGSIPGSMPGRDSKHLKPLPNANRYKPKLSELGSGNLLKSDMFLKDPSTGSRQNQSINCSFQETRKNSLVHADGKVSAFLTSIGSTGIGGTFVKDQTMQKDGSKIYNSHYHPKVALQPPVESNIIIQKFPRLNKRTNTHLIGAIPSLNALKYDIYSHARMQNKKYKDKSCLLNHNNRSYNLSNLKSKERHILNTSGDQDPTSDHSQITNRTVKSDSKALSKGGSTSKMSLLEVVKPAFETSRHNTSFSIDEAYDRLNELTLKNSSARNKLLRIQQSVLEMNVQVYHKNLMIQRGIWQSMYIQNPNKFLRDNLKI